ncbi:Eight transmembrane protein EpsH, putative exosortase OS=Singulisphaera acidiphila (strain ATCC BAA-1392 / DSM 18658 / VKM B-2454 / MOB10) GN=Sinac_2489 PE=4 SV=1: Exosortase_EpsH [Gemmata massiliana]|uniref:Uncharacterized protein n=1 Tax=Gemmata massiliana TaxID=1210884 RepID=A0A6P2D5H5_9BACT|nr:exosortase/archaeosortase family protein [Gemmata massiliana]VTR95695.1 Eight transmembrane protein EpsH, putative exosortase OS=Singulisphaera acidiphila (strain ATCC BAA-1392 / DSM 18658 / VKM B-2454 / MOB10) GN=Sinac_2489 PE=4 SV=1: Exosortase_EpsH [Gemmata massiliana]
MFANPAQRSLLLPVTASFILLGWAYWETLEAIGERWATDPQYSHGFLVPVFAGFLLWKRRDLLTSADFRPRWWGCGLVLLGVGLRFAGYAIYQSWLDASSLLVALAGIAGAAGGRRALIWAGPAILFLAFMIPLPYQIQMMLGGTLQRAATIASTYVLQTLNVPAVSEGNIIILTDSRLGVVEACNGLSMLVTFFALATGVAILAERSTVEKIFIVASAVPIAIAANVVRISLTGILFELQRGEWARMVFHDLAGWLMMPLALALLLGELVILRRAILYVPSEATA